MTSFAMKAPVVAVLLALQALLVSSHRVRPIWNIGHMVNALNQVDEFLNLGSNAIEADVSFGSDGVPRWTYHGLPCDCFRSCFKWEYIDRYLDYIRDFAIPNSAKYNENFVLLFLDLKVSRLSNSAKYQAGRNMADKLINIYWRRGKDIPRAPVLLSFPNINDINFVHGFESTMKKEGFSYLLDKIGWDISNNEDLDRINTAWRNIGFMDKIWQGDGISNCLPRWASRLRDAIRRRDEPRDSICKTYYWTLDKQSTMRKTLRMGVDGVITNHPDRLKAVLEEPEFSGKFRLATVEDNPWEKIPSVKRLEYLTGRKEYEAEELLINCDNSTEEQVYPHEWKIYEASGGTSSL